MAGDSSIAAPWNDVLFGCRAIKMQEKCAQAMEYEASM